MKLPLTIEISPPYTEILDANGEVVCEWSECHAREAPDCGTLAIIVNCVNQHDKVMALLEEAYDSVVSNGGDRTDLADRIRAALIHPAEIPA